MKLLRGRQIVLGVTGGIAAYKSAELVRRLRDAGAQVRVVMTAGATKFVTPLTFQAVSGHRVYGPDMFISESDDGMDHIHLARWADAVVVAPASANFIARLSMGMADDLLAAICLATTATVAVAPAMNKEMWNAAATTANVAKLRARGVHIVGPDAGDQACGEQGLGRMREVNRLVEDVARLFGADGALAGKRVLITAGPTREPIDPVRFISNRSSGKMGVAMAIAAASEGADVTVVSGPMRVTAPPYIANVAVETAEQMWQAVAERLGETDIFIAAAAVADFRAESVATDKVAKADLGGTLKLVPTTDILAAVCKAKPRPFVVGFAAETRDVEARGKEKLDRKGADVMIVNPVGQAGTGFDADDNQATMLWPGGRKEFPRARKNELAKQLMSVISERYHEAKNSA